MLNRTFRARQGFYQAIFFAACICGGGLRLGYAAPSIEATSQELKGVQQDIKAEKARLAALDAERELESERLRGLENQQAEAARALYEASFAVNGKEDELTRLRTRHTQLEDDIAKGLLSLDDNLRALYFLGSGNGLEGVLSPGGRADQMRIEGYLAHLRASRVAALEHLRVAREDNMRVQREIEFALEELTRMQLLAESEQVRLDALRVEHQKAVDALEARHDVGEARVRQMTRDQQSLERTLDKLEQAERIQAQAEARAEAEKEQREAEAAEQRKQEEMHAQQREAQARQEELRKVREREEEAAQEAAALAKRDERQKAQPQADEQAAEKKSVERRGSVADNGQIPVNGRRVRGFGEPTGVGELRSRGVFFAAAEGSRVRALAEGKVVFADWVRGYGNLIIVQHKGGYLSLYAQNEALLQRNGARVQRGEVLATAGRSGGERQTGVYIEVRRGGQPINPTRWAAWPKK